MWLHFYNKKKAEITYLLSINDSQFLDILDQQFKMYL